MIRAARRGVIVCPVCGAPLDADERTLRCGRRHAFDRAREGYCHLAPAGHGKTAMRGDTREMLRARRRIFERGFYAPLAEALAERILREPISPGFTVLDAGCGEGYYIGHVSRALAEHVPDAACCSIGVDVSKDGLKLAARAHHDVCFVVNDVTHRLTVADRCVDVLLDVFAPRNAAEFARVVKRGGLLVVVIPHARHLEELRERLPLLGIEPEKRERVIARLGEAFRLEAERALDYRRALDAEDVRDLIGMTPSAWHLDTADIEPVQSWQRTEVTFAMRLLAFRRGRDASDTFFGREHGV